MFAPDGRRRSPCVPVNLSPIDTTVARLLCEDGWLLGTSDGGDSWVQFGSLRAVSIDFSTPGDGVALAGREDCSTAVMTTSDGGTNWSRLACLSGGETRAISREGEALVALVEDKALGSTDGGSTWSVRQSASSQDRSDHTRAT